MALQFPQISCLLLLLYLLRCSSEIVLEMIDQPPRLKCGMGLTDCDLLGGPQYTSLPLRPEDTADVLHVELKAILCCLDGKDCKPCLQIALSMSVAGLYGEEEGYEESDNRGDEDSAANEHIQEGSGHPMPQRQTAMVNVCLSSPGLIGYCRTIRFRPTGATHTEMTQIWLTEDTKFGNVVLVHICALSKETHEFTIPSLQHVCALTVADAVKECDAPVVRAVMDHEKKTVQLQLDRNDTATENKVLMCQLIWDEVPGQFFEWQKTQRDMTFPVNSIAPCLCFQVWWKGEPLRRKSCPFKSLQEVFKRMQENISVSIAEAPSRDHGIILSWNVTAPCRLQGDVWLCEKDAAGQCKEVKHSRQRLHNHARAVWSSFRNGHWINGEFINASLRPELCVKMKVHGMDSDMEPKCPFTSSPWRWSLPVVVGLLSLSLLISAVYAVQRVFKGHLQKWLKEGDVKGAICGGHVVILYPPAGNQGLTRLICRLGSALQALGLSVSLDLWSQAELSALGPVPWLHSCLDRLQKEGGKVVLVLTRASWEMAEEWSSQGRERDLPMECSGKVGEETRAATVHHASTPYPDVFSASLSCILADYLQGQAGKRFVLVRFESQPPQDMGFHQPLPELFRGVRLFSLPSQSLAFLTEVSVGDRGASESVRRTRTRGLRVASRMLARGLRRFSGSTALHFVKLSQDFEAASEDPWEMVPLQPCESSSPPSPDSSPEVGGRGQM